jgi:hypothetical protein
VRAIERVGFAAGEEITISLDRTLMTAGNDPERPLIGPAVVQIRSDRQRAIVGMRPELNVLVPFDFFAPFSSTWNRDTPPRK